MAVKTERETETETERESCSVFTALSVQSNGWRGSS